MHMSAFCHQAFIVLTIYYIWHVYLQSRLRGKRTLRERVAYMLWVVANPVA
jgi:hypothetical protein